MAAAIPFIGAGVSMLGAVQGAHAEAQSLENQAQSLELRADMTRREGADQSALIRSQKDPILGQVTAQAAGGGVEVGTGSVLDVIKDNAFNIEMDALTTMESAARQANTMDIEAKYARAGKPSGIGTLLGTAGAGLSGWSAGKSAIS